MSEQRKNYMAELDSWSEANIIDPLAAQDLDEAHPYAWAETVEKVKKLIREKVLESYRNGQKAPKPSPRRVK